MAIYAQRNVIDSESAELFKLDNVLADQILRWNDTLQEIKNANLSSCLLYTSDAADEG